MTELQGAELLARADTLIFLLQCVALCGGMGLGWGLARVTVMGLRSKWFFGFALSCVLLGAGGAAVAEPVGAPQYGMAEGPENGMCSEAHWKGPYGQACQIAYFDSPWYALENVCVAGLLLCSLGVPAAVIYWGEKRYGEDREFEGACALAALVVVLAIGVALRKKGLGLLVVGIWMMLFCSSARADYAINVEAQPDVLLYVGGSNWPGTWTVATLTLPCNGLYRMQAARSSYGTGAFMWERQCTSNGLENGPFLWSSNVLLRAMDSPGMWRVEVSGGPFQTLVGEIALSVDGDGFLHGSGTCSLSTGPQVSVVFGRGGTATDWPGSFNQATQPVSQDQPHATTQPMSQPAAMVFSDPKFGSAPLSGGLSDIWDRDGTQTSSYKIGFDWKYGMVNTAGVISLGNSASKRIEFDLVPSQDGPGGENLFGLYGMFRLITRAGCSFLLGLVMFRYIFKSLKRF